MLALLLTSSLAVLPMNGPVSKPSCTIRTDGRAALAGEPRVTLTDLIAVRDIGGMADLEAPFSVSPDGTKVAVAFREADVERNDYCQAFAIVDIAAARIDRTVHVGGGVRLTRYDAPNLPDYGAGGIAPLIPRWSPDGRWLAYLERRDGIWQLMRVSATDGAPEQLTYAAVDIRDFQWGLDASEIRYSTRPGDPEAQSKLAEEGRRGFRFDARWVPGWRNMPFPALTPTRHFILQIATGTVREAEERALDPSADALAVAVDKSGNAARLQFQAPGVINGPKLVIVQRSTGEQLICRDAVCANARRLWWGDTDTLIIAREAGWGGSLTELLSWKLSTGKKRSLVMMAGYGLSGLDVLVLDEAGQLGNRQALRVLEISRRTGARLILLGDNKQTGAIEQGKAFWLMQQLGMPTSQLTESRRQETARMKEAVTRARAGDYAGSLEQLDKVVSGGDAETLAKGLVAEWTRLRPETRATTNILVLDNATRLIVNMQVRETLQREGAVAAQDVRLAILSPAGLTDQEKHLARFYASGQVVTFGRDQAQAGLARDAEYRVLGTMRDERGRPMVRLVDEQGRVARWDPRLTNGGQVNVFVSETRSLAQGDRIQWRLVSHELGVKNAQRGTVEGLDGALATIRWDKGERPQEIDLSQHKSWDHGYAETIYSAQSRTYARVYVLAPLGSPLVTGQNYYTAITRARLGVKLWTQDKDRLVEKLERASGEKTSALEGLGRLDRDRADRFASRYPSRIESMREEQQLERREHAERLLNARLGRRASRKGGLAVRLATKARSLAETLELHLSGLLERSVPDERPADRSEAQPSQPGGRHGIDR